MKKIYLITPNLLNKKFYFYLPKVLATKKVKFLQIRCKKYSSKTIEEHINKIIKICSKFNVKLIINDDASFVNKYKNIGFHLGQSDLKKKKNKIFLNKNFFYGITCHNSISLAKKAIRLGASYIAYGAFYSTQTKKVKFNADKNILLKSKKLKTKIVAIGGITNLNYKDLLKWGAHYIAISGFIWKNKQMNPVKAINLFK